MQRNLEQTTSENALEPKARGRLAAFARGVPAFFQGAYAAYLALVVIATIAIAPFVSFACKPALTDSNYIFAIAGLAIGCAFCLIAARAKADGTSQSGDSRKRFLVIIGLGSVLLLIVQTIIFCGCRFETGWDVMRLVQMSNDAKTMYAETIPEYYSIYPNQLFLGGLFRRIGALAALLGIADTYAVLTFCGLLCVTVSIPLAAFSAEKLAGATAGYFTFAVAALLVGVNPWILVPYSDAYAMPFVTLQVWAFLCLRKNQVRWPVIAVSALIGYFIKPTAIFALAAICIVAFCRFVQERCARADNGESRWSAKEAATTIAAVLLSCAVAYGFSVYVKDFGIEVDEDRSFGIPHYLMMGANEESFGAFLSEDTGISLRAQTKEERAQVNLAVWKERIAEKGVTGCVILAARKSLTNYADGTFAFGEEGAFFQEIKGDNETLKWFFGIDVADPPYGVLAQILWYLVLCGAVAGSIPWRKADKRAAAIAIALLFLSGFLMIFECRARYLYLYAPMFVVLASVGWHHLSRRISERRG